MIIQYLCKLGGTLVINVPTLTRVIASSPFWQMRLPPPCIYKGEKTMDITNIIQNTGFPIACVIMLAYYTYTTNKANREENNKREERLYQIIDTQSTQLAEVSTQMAEVRTSIDNLNDTLKRKGVISCEN